MKTTDANAPPEKVDRPPAKHSYRRPELREFGKVHLLTQSTGPFNGDGGQNMMQ